MLNKKVISGYQHTLKELQSALAQEAEIITLVKDLKNRAFNNCAPIVVSQVIADVHDFQNGNCSIDEVNHSIDAAISALKDIEKHLVTTLKDTKTIAEIGKPLFVVNPYQVDLWCIKFMQQTGISIFWQKYGQKVMVKALKPDHDRAIQMAKSFLKVFNPFDKVCIVQDGALVPITKY